MKTKTFAVDFDGTLAHKTEPYDPAVVGEPVERMVNRVKQWLKDGHTVVIFTARASREGHTKEQTQAALLAINEFCKKHLGRYLEITCIKSPGFSEFWDDRGVGVMSNHGMTSVDAALLGLASFLVGYPKAEQVVDAYIKYCEREQFQFEQSQVPQGAKA